METNELIAALAQDTPPVPTGQSAGRLVIALLAGGLVAMGLVAVFVGDPLLGAKSLDATSFGVKIGFTVSLLLLGVVLLYRAGRPGDDPRAGLPWIAAPVVIMALIAAMAIASAPAEARSALIRGSMWRTCLLSVTLLSLPVFALLIWAFRRFAPTDLKLAGMLAGLVSGSTAALVYALHCPESSPAFLFAWFGLAIAVAGLAGRWAGPIFLRW